MKATLRISTAALLTLAAVAIAAGCARKAEEAAPAEAPKAASLYDRLGGREAIAAVVDEFVARVAADTRINRYFGALAADATKMAAFKSHLVDQICQAGGGPCTYTGKDMRTAHAGLGITGADFDALVEDLVGALDKFQVGQTEKDELIGVLAPMRGDVVATAS